MRFNTPGVRKVKTEILISKKHKKEIEISVHQGGTEIDIKCEFLKFVEALISEMGNPTLMVTKLQLKNRILKSSEIVFEEFKKETARVV